MMARQRAATNRNDPEKNAGARMYGEYIMAGACGLGARQLTRAEDVVERGLAGLGTDIVMLIDDVGNILLRRGESRFGHVLHSLAALAAANFSAMGAMARILGEEGFSMLLYKGERENLQVCQVTEELMLVAVFGPRASLGALRLGLDSAIHELRYVLEDG
jgi:predicted regulator of Ras-like GTPase activity (Roadblock/LC7/MglB family)